MKYYADVHTHLTLRPYNFFKVDKDSKKASVWYQDKFTKNQRFAELIKFTQADLTTIVNSNTKLVYIALYPFEENWLGKKDSYISEFFFHIYSGFPMERVKQIKDSNYIYFNELVQEYKFLCDQIKTPFRIVNKGVAEWYFAKIPKNNQEFEQFMNEENTIVIIPTIEGANSLMNSGCENIENFNTNHIHKNIYSIKAWEHRPFYITLSHHFFNGVCGHCKSIYPKGKIDDYIQKMMLDQKLGMDIGFTPNGRALLYHLLEIGDTFNNREKRILVDTKHLSVKARKEFYDIVSAHNLKNPEDNIPIIASHCAYSGIETFEELVKISKIENYESQNDFNPSSLNLCDQDIKFIFKSKGLIGLNLDQRIMSSNKFIQKSKTFEKDIDKLLPFWAEHIVNHFVSMANVVLKEDNSKDSARVWDMFCIGSDFDGFINPIDSCVTTEDYDDLDYHLMLSFSKNDFFKRNNFGLNPEKLARKIMFENAIKFAKENYYLSDLQPATAI